MEFLNKIPALLNKPFPVEESRAVFFRITASISVFVTLFLYFFQPFGIADVESNQFWLCLGFGLSTFVGSVFYEFIIVWLFKLKGRREQFTFWKWILYVIGLIGCISVANFLYVRIVFFGFIQWDLLPAMIYGTFLIGIFPTVVLGTIALMRQEKKYQNIAAEINQKRTGISTSVNPKIPVVLNIPVNKIRYVESLQNYVQIGHVNSDGQLVKQVERATLKAILDETNGSSIVKCHRSFLVNKEAIISTSGNAQGLLLSLADCDKLIPVSRSFVPLFKGV